MSSSNPTAAPFPRVLPGWLTPTRYSTPTDHSSRLLCWVHVHLWRAISLGLLTFSTFDNLGQYRYVDSLRGLDKSGSVFVIFLIVPGTNLESRRQDGSSRRRLARHSQQATRSCLQHYWQWQFGSPADCTFTIPFALQYRASFDSPGLSTSCILSWS